MFGRTVDIHTTRRGAAALTLPILDALHPVPAHLLSSPLPPFPHHKIVSSGEERPSSSRLRSYGRSRRSGRESESSSRSRSRDSHRQASSRAAAPGEHISEGTLEPATSSPEHDLTPAAEDAYPQAKEEDTHPHLGSSVVQYEPPPRSTERQPSTPPSAAARLP